MKQISFILKCTMKDPSPTSQPIPVHDLHLSCHCQQISFYLTHAVNLPVVMSFTFITLFIICLYLPLVKCFAAMHHQSYPFYIYQFKRVPKDTISIFMQPCIINIVLFKFIKLSTQVNYLNTYATMHHQSCPFYIYQVTRVSKNLARIYMQPLC